MNHRKTIRHYHEPGDLHELTFSCFERRPLLIDDEWLASLSRCIDEAAAETDTRLVAFVYMPEHLHLLIHPSDANPAISLFIARLKQPFSKLVKSALIDRNDRRLVDSLTVQERPGKFCFRFWQEGPGFDRNLSSPSAISSAIDYIHRNPVRRGLCDRAVDWRWSSARYYLAEPERQQFEGLPFVHGLPAGALH